MFEFIFDVMTERVKNVNINFFFILGVCQSKKKMFVDCYLMEDGEGDEDR